MIMLASKMITAASNNFKGVSMTQNNSKNKQIPITVFLANNDLNKSFDSDGKKTSKAFMKDGIAEIEYLNSVEDLFTLIDTLLSRQAIALGRFEKEVVSITTSSKPAEGKVARTKKYMNFSDRSFLLIDYDPSKEGYQIDSPEQLVEVLRDIDPELEQCEIGVRYGSSYGIFKEGQPLSSKKSFHAYFIVTNASNEKVAAYKDFLISSAWAKGYGHIELSSSGSVLRRQIFDATVFSPERLIFEAKPTLAKGITREVPLPYIAKAIR